jgi:GntR family transcriptional regulator
MACEGSSAKRKTMAARAREQSVLSRRSPEPLYRQLAQHLENAIRSGALKPGDRLESEGQLGRRFAVSRITVRLAVEDLVRKQLIVRKQGKGTFVVLPAVKHDLKRLHGLLGSLFSQAESASTRLVRYELGVPPRETAGLLNLQRGQTALALDRLYLIDGRPVALVRAWLVPEVAKLARAKADLISTEDMMREAGIRVASSQLSIRAEAAGTVVGRFLKISARAPVMVLRRTAFGPDGMVKETGRISFRSDAYELVCATRSLGAAETLFDLRNVEEIAR